MKLSRITLKLAQKLQWTHIPLGLINLFLIYMYITVPNFLNNYQKPMLFYAVVVLLIAFLEIVSKAIRAFGSPSFDENPVYQHAKRK